MCLVPFESWELILQFVSSGLTKLDETIVTVGAQLLWGGRYGCNNGPYGCTIVMSYIDINKAVSQWLLTFNLCVSVTWSLTCAFHIPCTHTPEIIDIHKGVRDNINNCLVDILNNLSNAFKGGLVKISTSVTRITNIVMSNALSFNECKTYQNILIHWQEKCTD